MALLENVFSWSKSRDEQFRECQRKYFFDKYLSWGGWDKAAPERTRKAYIYKNLKNRWAWKGETVHHIIEGVLKDLRSGRPVSAESALKRLTEAMRGDYRASKAKKYLDDPKKTLGLFEHEYEKKVSDDVWKKIHDESADCLRHFFGSRFFKELSADDKKNWLVIEDLEEFDFEGAKIFVKLDFARLKDGSVEIYDWKTGKDDGRDEVSVQIGAYAIYAMQKWHLPLSQVRAYLFNLTNPGPEGQTQVLSDALLQKTRDTIRSSVVEMRKLLVDPVKNIPKPEEEFGFTSNERLCGFCQFQKLCPKFSS